MMFNAMLWNLSTHEWWIIGIGALVCASCSLLGCFLVLKRLALMGDAISHAVLPGIVLAVIISGQLHSIWVLVGAGIVGILTPLLVHWIQETKTVHEDSALGIVFSMLFAFGIVLISQAGNVDLDPDCVLYGEIATAPFDTWILEIGGDTINLGPKAFWILLAVLIFNLTIILLLYKEWKLSIFDSHLAHSLGFRPAWLHYLLMAMIALTTIASFESVGSILVVAMFICPAATAYLLTNRFGLMLIWAMISGILCAVLGYLLTWTFGGDISIAGSMSVTAGGLFAMAFFLAPSTGILSQRWRAHQMRNQLLQDHLILGLYRSQEKGNDWISRQDLLAYPEAHSSNATAALRKLNKKGLVSQATLGYRLTEQGLTYAKQLIRSHRLWETYIHHLGTAPDHLHRPASEMEHFLSPELCQEIAQDLQFPKTNPSGKSIPK